jgi:uncharacterized small protein (DUF1192 family)
MNVQQNASKRPGVARLRIWEIDRHWHCSIIGTCLTFAEAAKIGRKFGATCDDPSQLNAVIHSMLVRDCKTRNPIAIHVEKKLNNKHAAMVKKFQKLSTDEEILELWKASLRNGLVPGAYWAVATTPSVQNTTATRVFSDVHMLSHLLGSSNQQVISRVAELEEKIAVNENKLSRLREISRQREDAHRHEIISRDAEVSTLKIRLLKHENAGSRRGDGETGSLKEKIAVAEAKIETLEGKNERVLSALNLQHGFAKQREDEIERLNLAHAELEKLVSYLADKAGCEDEFQLGNINIVYVGGIGRSFQKIGKAIEQIGGEISFFSGEEGDCSTDHLISQIKRADLVVISITNISHRIALIAKKTSKRLGVAFCVVKTPGLGCLMLTLRQHLEKQGSG